MRSGEQLRNLLKDGGIIMITAHPPSDNVILPKVIVQALQVILVRAKTNRENSAIAKLKDVLNVETLSVINNLHVSLNVTMGIAHHNYLHTRPLRG